MGVFFICLFGVCLFVFCCWLLLCVIYLGFFFFGHVIFRSKKLLFIWREGAGNKTCGKIANTTIIWRLAMYCEHTFKNMWNSLIQVYLLFTRDGKINKLVCMFIFPLHLEGIAKEGIDILFWYFEMHLSVWVLCLLHSAYFVVYDLLVCNKLLLRLNSKKFIKMPHFKKLIFGSSCN